MNNLGWLEENKLFIFVYLANKSRSSSNVVSTMKRVKFKYNNVFVDNLVSMKLDLSIYNIIFLYVYIYKNIIIYTLSLIVQDCK